MAIAESVHPSPPTESDEIKELYRLFSLTKAPALVGPDQTAIPIPESIYDILVKVMGYMLDGKGVTVVPVMQELTTQQAANRLGVSRPFLIKLLDQEAIPFHRTGAHRRIYLKDVVSYQTNRDANRKRILTELAKKELASGHYDTVYDAQKCE
jgi:excisionase family DNA binding protein